MPKYRPQPTSKFKRDVKSLKKRGYDLSLMYNVIEILADGKVLPEKYCNHPLTGNRKGYRDCHILNDWILVYKIEKDKLVLILSETGTHSDIFR